ncbi:unnamed protein product [Bemisia tabaci]|uniref:Uncharacterized protein n=1 Tax=Bemisia tabaci TaxID=7038 RepID=A0A9P0CBW3_BEMTA|nr:unnamed protein product [Bemisia tabaci]
MTLAMSGSLHKFRMLIAWFPILVLPVLASYARAKPEEAEEVSQTSATRDGLSDASLYDQSEPATSPACDTSADSDIESVLQEQLPPENDSWPSDEDLPDYDPDDWADGQHRREKRQAEGQNNDPLDFLEHLDPKRAKPAFNSWGGKRTSSFHSWGGKRSSEDSIDALEETKRNDPFIILKFADSLYNTNGGFKRRPSFNSWGGKRAGTAAFNSWGGKRAGAAAFNSWGGKRGPNFNSWGGKRAPPKPAFNSWGGKRGPAFNSWGGKRGPAFNSWGGKRANFNSWGGKRGPAFNSWGGKRSPAFNSWGGKRANFNSWGGKRANFNSWGGKRANFNSWGGKRSPAFNSWGGKRAASGSTYNAQGGKRGPAFYSWGGKRSSNENYNLGQENKETDASGILELVKEPGNLDHPISLNKREATKSTAPEAVPSDENSDNTHTLVKREVDSREGNLDPSIAAVEKLYRDFKEREKKCAKSKSIVHWRAS